MYITTFYRKSDEPIRTNTEKTNSQPSEESYYYNNEAAAKEHMDLFRKDTSNLYSRISVVDDSSNQVLHLLVFNEKGEATIVLSQGALVRLAPEHRTEDEAKYIYAVTNNNDRTMRCEITCLNSGMAIQPRELVGVNMIEVLGDDITVEAIAKRKKR